MMGIAKTCPECEVDIDHAPLVVVNCGECRRRREIEEEQPNWIREAAACIEFGATPLDCRLNMNAMRRLAMSEGDGHRVFRVAADAYRKTFYGAYPIGEDPQQRAGRAMKAAREAVLKSGIRPERIERL